MTASAGNRAVFFFVVHTVTLLIHYIYMATSKKRINISISKDIDVALGRLAKRDQVPQATKAEHLLRLALELEEDQVLNEIARKRESVKSTVFVSHASAWR